MSSGRWAAVIALGILFAGLASAQPPYPGQKVEVQNLEVWIMTPRSVWDAEAPDAHSLPASDIGYLLYSYDGTNDAPDPAIPREYTTGLPKVYPNQVMRFKFDLASVGTEGFTTTQNLFIYAISKIPKEEFGWAADYNLHSFNDNAIPRHTFIEVRDYLRPFILTEYAPTSDPRSDIFHEDKNIPVRKEHISISNVAGNRSYDVYIAYWNPANNILRQRTGIVGPYDLNLAAKVYFVNDDYDLLASCGSKLFPMPYPTQWPNWCTRSVVDGRDGKTYNNMATQCCFPAQFGGFVGSGCGGEFKCCEAIDPADPECAKVNTYCPVPQDSNYTGMGCVKNLRPTHSFTGRILIYGACVDAAGRPIAGMTPTFTLAAGGERWIDMNSIEIYTAGGRFVSNESGEKACTLRRECYPNWMGSGGAPVNDQGKNIAHPIHPSGGWGSFSSSQHYSCIGEPLLPALCVAIIPNSSVPHTEAVGADKHVYAPDGPGEIWVDWRWNDAPFGYSPADIPKGTSINVKIYKLNDDGTRGVFVDGVNKIPDELVNGPVLKNDKTQHTAYIDFTNTTSGYLSSFEVEVKLVLPAGNTMPLLLAEDPYYCNKTVVTKKRKVQNMPFIIDKPSVDYSCTKEIIDWAAAGGLSGKAAKFICTILKPTIADTYYFVQDFSLGYSSSDVGKNLIAGLASFYATPNDDMYSKDASFSKVLGASNPVDGGTLKKYVSELAPDICPQDLIMPGTWPAGIEMKLNPWFTNCGFLNIGSSADVQGEELPPVSVGMDYGDGATENVGPYFAATGTAILASATHAFSDVGKYKITATADPAASPDLIVEGDEGNNEVFGDVTARPACSTVFCDNSFVEKTPAEAAGADNCALCGTVPGYTCIVSTNYVCYNGFTSPACDGGYPLPGCPLCEVCADDSDCKSGNCNAGICDAAAATAGPGAILNKDPISQDPSTKAITLELFGSCTDTISGSACIDGSKGCVSSCVLIVTNDADGRVIFEEEYVIDGDVTGVPTASVPVANTREYAVGDYTATLATTSCGGDLASDVEAFTVSDNVWPRVDITAPVITGNTHTIIEGNPVTVQGEISDIEDDAAAPQLPLQYEWSIVDEAGVATLKDSGTGTGAVAPLALDLDAGTYEVVLTATDSGGAQNSASIFINVTPVIGDVKVNYIVPGNSIGEEGGTFGAKVRNTNETPVLNVNVELKVTCISPVGCTKSATCTKSTGIIGAYDPVATGDEARVFCTFGPGAEADVAFANREQYRYTVKITGVTCAGGTTCDKPSGNSDSTVFSVIKLQAIAVPELPLVFAVLAALAVVALLNRKR